MKPTVENARKLGADRFGWASFKHRLMRELGIAPDKYATWDVPKEWRDVFLKANGRKPSYWTRNPI